MRLLLRIAILASAHALLLRPSASGRGCAPRRAVPPAEEDDDGALMVAAVASIARPLGLILEERGGGGGVEVVEIDPRGNARGAVCVGDVILMVDAEPCGGGTFDDVAGLIGGGTGDACELTLGRRVGAVRVSWPNGVGVAALPGEPLAALAARASYPVKYSCAGGSCGTCEHRLAAAPGEPPRYTRVCVARVPKAAAGDVTVLPGDRFM